MTIASKGDEVQITITGKVAGDSDSEHSYCHAVKDTSGFTHHVFLEGAATTGSGCTVTLVKKAESFVIGEAYKDADGDVFIRTSTGWVGRGGTIRRDSYPQRPLVPLAAASTVTEDAMREAIRKAARGRGVAMGGITVGSIIQELKAVGVKVAK